MTKLFRHTNQRYLEGKCLSLSNVVPRRGPFTEGRTGPIAAGPFIVESDRNILTTTFTYAAAASFAASEGVTGTAPDMTLTRVGSGGAFTATMVGRWITFTGGNAGTYLITSFIDANNIGFRDVAGVTVTGPVAGTWDISTFNVADLGERGALLQLNANTSPTTAPIATATNRVDPYAGLTFPIIETIDGETVRLGGGCRFDTPSTTHNMSFTMLAAASCAIGDPGVYLHPVATIRADSVGPIAPADGFTIRHRGLEWKFRFDTSNTVSSEVWIDISTNPSASQLATLIANAINNCVGVTFSARVDPVDSAVVNFFFDPGEVEPIELSASIAAATSFEVQSTSDILRPWHINQAVSFENAGTAEFEMLGRIGWQLTWVLEDQIVISDWTGQFATLPSTPEGVNTGSVAFNASKLTLTDAAGLFTAGMVGHYMAISGATNAGNNGVWEIIEYTSPTVIVLHAPSGATEGAGSLDWAMGFRWFVHDRKAWNQDDFFRRILHPAMLDAGYNVIGRPADGVIRCYGGGADGDLFEFWDGSYRAVFELDDNASVAAGHHLVAIGGAPTAASTATALAAAINAARGAAAFTDVTCKPCTLVATRTDEYLDSAAPDANIVLRQLEYGSEGSGIGTGSLTVPVAGPNPRLVELTQASTALTSTATADVTGTAPEMTVVQIASVTDAMVGQWVTIPAGGGVHSGTFLITAVLSTTSFKYLDPLGVAATNVGGTWTVVRRAFHSSMIGQYITIAGATTAANNGKFVITSVTSSNVLRYRNEGGVAEAFTGTWESKARQADVNEPVTGTLVDFEYSGMLGGQHPGQMRGKNGPFTLTYGIQQDWVYFSAGESADISLNYFRRTFIHAIATCTGVSSVTNVDNTRRGYDWAMFQSWDPWFNNGIADTGSNVYPQGNGSQPVRSPQSRNGNLTAATATPTWAVSSGGMAWGGAADAGVSIFGSSTAHVMNYNNTLGILGGDPWELDYVIFGDKDELHLYGLSTGAGGAYEGLFNVLEEDQNPHKFLLRTAVTAGSNKRLNIGPYNPQTKSPPLQVGDRIQVYGQGVNVTGTFTAPTFPSGGAFVESTTITNFGVVDASVAVPDYYIEVSSLQEAYQVGSIVGEEAGAIGIHQGMSTAFDTNEGVIMQNSANFNVATYHDYSGIASGSGLTRGYGFPGTPTSIATSMAQFDPNQRSARWGLLPVLLKMSNDGEFRGSLRYYWLAPLRAGANTYVRATNGDVYYLAEVWYAQTFALMGFGPMTSRIAGLS